MDRPMVTTTIMLTREDWSLLRRLAELHHAAAGGRTSASGVLSRLVRAEAKAKKLPGAES